MQSEFKRALQFENQLSEVFRNIHPIEAKGIVSRALVEAYKPNPFEEERGEALFDSQVTKLKERGYPEFFGMSTEEFDQSLSFIRPVENTSRDYEGDIPFLIVFPPEVLPISRQLKVARYLFGKGRQYLADEDFRNAGGIESPVDHPYLIYGVSIGDELMGFSTHGSRIALKSWQRTPLTLAEGVALATHYPNIFGFMNITLPGTVHRLGIPDLYELGRDIKLKREPADASDDRWGTPSVALRGSSLPIIYGGV